MIGKLYRQNPIFIRHTGDHLNLVVILVLLASLSVAPLSSAVADSSELMKLISENEDIPITVNDLAFFLVIHDFGSWVNVTENHRENRMHRIHFGIKHPLSHLLALFSSSRTRPDFDAAPKKDYVEARLNSTVYKLVPNGPYPGLANVTIKKSI
jgi:ABC-type proline/glycine betaine transport system permease subunit